MTSLALALRQFRYQNTAFWRNPVAAFFTFVFPLMFLVILNLLFGSGELDIAGGTVHTSTFYVPAICALSVITACYTNLAIGMSFSRDEGILKRIRGTPIPTWSFLAGRIAHAVFLGILLTAIIMVVGVIFYDVDVPSNTLPAFLITLALGSATFCALGLAIMKVIPNAEASPAIVNASILPLMFISDIFIPLHDAPAWLTTVADIFPVRHFSVAMQTSFNPFEGGLGFEPIHLLVMAAWMVGGLLLALRTFSWEPSR